MIEKVLRGHRALQVNLAGLQALNVHPKGGLIGLGSYKAIVYGGFRCFRFLYRPPLARLAILSRIVKERFSLSYADLLGLPRVTQVSDFHCVEGWSVKDLRWGGARFSEIGKRAKPKSEARYAVFHALGTTQSRSGRLDHYVESLPVARLLDPGRECLLALSLDGKPLTDQHGASLRLISPYDLGYKRTKFIGRIEFSDKERPGWWTQANPIYPSEAPVPEDRLRKRPRTTS